MRVAGAPAGMTSRRTTVTIPSPFEATTVTPSGFGQGWYPIEFRRPIQPDSALIR